VRDILFHRYGFVSFYVSSRVGAAYRDRIMPSLRTFLLLLRHRAGRIVRKRRRKLDGIDDTCEMTEGH